MKASMNFKPGIAVIGLGYVGLPLALSYAMKGCKVYGIDINQRLVEELNQGITGSNERDGDKTLPEILQEQLENHRFTATTDLQNIAQSVSTYIVTVGIPIQHGKPVYSDLDQVADNLASVVKPGDLVMIRSTVVPGTTEERIVPILLGSGLTLEKELFVAYCSERIAEGRAFEEFRTMPLTLGGIGPESTKRASEVLKIVAESPIHVTDIKVVETSKVVENIYRDVNIAFAQEIAATCRALKIDTGELIATANSHSRVNILQPGVGVGGFCIPNAFYYLNAATTAVGLETPLLLQSRMVNEKIPAKIVTMVKHTLESNGKKLRGAKIAVLGLAMKDYSNDTRISPALDIVQLLENEGATIFAYDPQVQIQEHFVKQDVAECFYNADALLVLTMQHAFSNLNFPESLSTMSKNSVVFDAKRLVDKEICEHLHFTLLNI